MASILKLLLYFLLIALPTGVLIRIPVASSAFVYPVDIALVLIFFTLLALIYKSKKNLINFSLFKPLYLFIGFAFISLALNSLKLTAAEFLISFLYLIRFIIYSSLLFAFNYLDSRFNNRCKYLLALSGLVVVILGYIQYFLYPNLRNLYYLGWDEHLYRMFSTFLDPNFAGAFFVLELLLLLSLSTKSFVEKDFLIKRIFLSVSAALILVAVLLTYSRSAFLMLLVSLISYFVLIKKLRWLVVFAFFVVSIIIIVPKDFSLEPINPLRTASIKARMGSIEKGIEIFRTSPIYGVGFNSYRYAQQRHGFLDKENIESHAGAGVSNSYVFLLATTGIVGFLLYFNFWWRVLRLLFEREKKRTIGNLHFISAVTSSIIGLFAHSLFENTLFYPFIFGWVFILLGLLTKLERN